MSKIFFLGIMYDPEKENEIISNSKSNVSNAPNRFQMSVLDGMINNNIQNELEIINVLPVGTWPRQYNRLLLKTSKWNYKGVCAYEIGSINIPFLKQKNRAIDLEKYLKKNVNNGDKIVIYSCYLPFLEAIKKLDKSVSVTLIVTDIPEYYDLKKVSSLKAYLRKKNNNKIYNLINRVDSFVILTEQMKEKFDNNKPYIVVEGISSFPKDFTANEQSKKIVFYSGTLNYKYGIKNLLDAFENIKDEACELWICGSGEAAAEIIERAKKNERIKFYGFCSTDKVLELMKNATVLVNPRQNTEEYTKYSFPSKTMEYMASGIPVIMYKLDGIPDEYDDFLYYVENNSVEALTKKIDYVLSLDKEERILFGKKAKAFIDNNKNCTVQSKKIIDFVCEE